MDNSIQDGSLKVAFDALRALGDAVACLEQDSLTCHWVTPSFVELVDGNDDFAYVLQYFDGLERLLKNIEGSVSPQKSTLVYTTSQKKRTMEVTVTPFNAGYLLVRLVDTTQQTYSTQRYLEDRERLFSTSRTLSVSEMATTLAHEINQPIGTIANLVQGLRMRIKNGVGTSEDLDKALVRAGEQTQFAANIISRIRDYTYRKLPEFEPLRIVELLDSCVSLLDWEIQRQAIEFEPRYRLYPDSANIVVVGDETMLQQVIVNLMRNAMDAMQNNQQQRLLAIDYQVVGGAIELIIRDSGVGLDDDAKDKLFVPFVSTKPTGMGVGLNICRSFIELHQGKLWLSANEEPSRGCSAFIRLPLQQTQQQSAAF